MTPASRQAFPASEAVNEALGKLIRPFTPRRVKRSKRN